MSFCIIQMVSYVIEEVATTTNMNQVKDSSGHLWVRYCFDAALVAVISISLTSHHNMITLGNRSVNWSLHNITIRMFNDGVQV